MITRHPYDTSLAIHVSDDRLERAAAHRRARAASRHQRRASLLRPVGRLLVRLGTHLDGAPEAPAPTHALTPVRPR